MKLLEFYPTQQFTGQQQPAQRQFGHERDAEMKWHQQDNATRLASSNKQFYVQSAAGKKYGPFADSEKAYQFAGARKDLGPGAKVIVGAA